MLKIRVQFICTINQSIKMMIILEKLDIFLFVLCEWMMNQEIKSSFLILYRMIKLSSPNHAIGNVSIIKMDFFTCISNEGKILRLLTFLKEKNNQQLYFIMTVQFKCEMELKKYNTLIFTDIYSQCHHQHCN